METKSISNGGITDEQLAAGRRGAAAAFETPYFKRICWYAPTAMDYMFDEIASAYGGSYSGLTSALASVEAWRWALDRAVAKELVFLTPEPEVRERVVEVIKEVPTAPRQFPNSRITSSSEIAEAARKSVERLQRAEAEQKIVERELEIYNALREQTFCATGGSGSHAANLHARAQAKARLNEFIARMNPATKRFLGI